MRWPRSVERDEARGRVCADSPGTDRHARPGCSHPSDAASLQPLTLRGNSPPSRRLPARTGCGLTAYPYSEPVHEAAKMHLPWCSLSPAQQPGCGCVLPRRRVGSKPARPATGGCSVMRNGVILYSCTTFLPAARVPAGALVGIAPVEPAGPVQYRLLPVVPVPY